MPSSVPVVDLVPWFGGDAKARAAVAAEVDAALQSVGFFLLAGHGVPADLRDRVRAEAPDEDLVSLVYFYEADHDAVIESLQPPIGKRSDYQPVVSAQFLKTRLDAITIG